MYICNSINDECKNTCVHASPHNIITLDSSRYCTSGKLCAAVNRKVKCIQVKHKNKKLNTFSFTDKYEICPFIPRDAEILPAAYENKKGLIIVPYLSRGASKTSSRKFILIKEYSIIVPNSNYICSIKTLEDKILYLFEIFKTDKEPYP